MCYQHFHNCKYCKNQYECKDANYICPTINNDVDRFMCIVCKDREREDFVRLLNSGVPIPRGLSLEDWGKKQ